jgi:hypothetical protein
MKAQTSANPQQDPSATPALDEIFKLELEKTTVTLCLASTRSDGGKPELQTVQITDELANEFRDVCRKKLQALKKDKDAGDLALRFYSAGSKPDRNEVEFLDVSDHQHIKEQLAPLAAIPDLKTFQLDKEFIAGLRFYVIALGMHDSKHLYCFRSYSPKKELARSTKFAAMLAKGQFDKVREPMFLFDHNLDALAYDDQILVFNQDQFQKIFRFFELVVKTAEQTLATIKQVIPIANFDEFEQACKGHLQKLTKLRNIAQQPYLKQVTIADLKNVIKRYDLPIKTKKVKSKEMLVFDQKDRWAILKLLDDDYLESLLTERHYEVTGKRPHA